MVQKMKRLLRRPREIMRYVVCAHCGRNFDRKKDRVPDEFIQKNYWGNNAWICPYCGTDNNPRPR